MQDPKAASGDLYTTTKSPSPSPAVNPNQITQNTPAAGGGVVELKGGGGSSAAAAVGDGSWKVKGSVADTDTDRFNPKRKWKMRDTPNGSPRCPECALEFPSWRSVFGHLKAHPDRTYRDNVAAGQGIDLNMEATEGETVKTEVELESTLTPMERVEETSDAAANESTMEGMESSDAAEGKIDSSADHRGKRMKVEVEVKDETKEAVETTCEAKPAQKNEKEAGSSSSDESKKVFAFDLNELPPPDDEEDNVVP